MSKISAIMESLTTISQQSAQDIFYKSVEEKLDLHLISYYNRLQEQVDKLYAKIMIKDITTSMKSINAQLKTKKVDKK